VIHDHCHLYSPIYITIHVTHLLYDLWPSLPVSSLCVGVLYLSLVLWICATPSCCLVGVVVCSFVESWLLEFVCLLLSLWTMPSSRLGKSWVLRPFWSWDRSTMAAMPNLARFPCFSWLSSAMNITDPIQPTGVVTMDSLSVCLLPALGEPLMT